jgi:hypothetical protein
MRQPMLDPGMVGFTAIPTEAVEHGEVFTQQWIVDLILDLVSRVAA